jgi:hypothetical protein
MPFNDGLLYTAASNESQNAATEGGYPETQEDLALVDDKYFVVEY